MVMVAPNGARKTQVDHPQLPITPEQLAKEAQCCLEAGASVIHLHVRNENHQHSLSPKSYQTAINAIKQRVGNEMLIQVTTEAVGLYTADEQMETVRQLNPDAVSLSVNELSRATPAQLTAFSQYLRQHNILPQWILYNLADVQQLQSWIQENIIVGEAHPVLFVLGRYDASETANTDNLLANIQRYLTNTQNICSWSICAFGTNEQIAMRHAANLGGHARIGFENNLFNQTGQLAANNAELIHAFVEQLPAYQREAASAMESRELLTPIW